MVEKLKNLASELPDPILNRQINRNLPLQRTHRTLNYPNPQLFEQTKNIPVGAQYPYCLLDGQVADLDITSPDLPDSPENQHRIYRSGIPSCFPRVNSYYRHYMPNKHKPWSFDTDFQQFATWIDHLDSDYHIWNQNYGPYPQNTTKTTIKSKRNSAQKFKQRDVLADYVNPIKMPFDPISPPGKCWDTYDDPDYRFSPTKLGSSCH